ncbi:MAG TPA: glycoside hydrolase family 6 protein [Solirubrobacteraceae bacterium]|nr:glycoside hydrolase family 6 protein [Solirubrobacteraceae bacterium]
MAYARRIAILVATLVGALLGPAAAHAAPFDPLGFRLSSPVYFVNENAGQAVITITRLDTSREAQIRYIALPGTAERGIDFEPVKAMINFLPGQASATFSIPIIDHGIQGLVKTVKIGLFGPSPIGMSVPSQAVLTILNNDPVSIVQSVLNPLGLSRAPASDDPLTGAHGFVDPQSWYANEVSSLRSQHPSEATMMNVIAGEPGVQRFGHGIPNPAIPVQDYLARAQVQQPGTVPMLSTYWLVDAAVIHPRCGHYSDSPARQAAWQQWIQNFANGIGDYRAIVFLEEDSLITVGCLSHHGLQVRMAELKYAVNVLSKLPRTVIYLDAGAADALPATKAAQLLRAAGVAHAQGFFLNATHFDWTLHEIHYGWQISRRIGGKHFVVNTADNGRGPLVPRNRTRRGNEVLCNPPGRGLGPKPTFNTGYRDVDAFAWIANPGKSGGSCRPGAPAVGYYWPAYALQLVRNANFRVH